MKLHLLTVGQPHLPYAVEGWQTYTERLSHYHKLRKTHLPDKYGEDATRILRAAGDAFKIVLAIEGRQFSSKQLAHFLGEQATTGTEICFIIGGPNGLPAEVIQQADVQWSLSPLTFPHDLAMVVTTEALYRATTINAGHPYHK